MNLIIALLLTQPSAFACPEKPKNLTVKGATFQRYRIGVNCSVQLSIGNVHFNAAEINSFVPGPIKDKSGNVIGVSERQGDRVFFFSVKGQSKDSTLPYLAVLVKSGNEASIEMIKGNKIVGKTQLMSEACTKSPSLDGENDMEMEGASYKTAGGGCEAGLEKEAFTAREYGVTREAGR